MGVQSIFFEPNTAITRCYGYGHNKMEAEFTHSYLVNQMLVSTDNLVNYDTNELLDLGFEDSVGLFYVPEWNVFMDEAGFIVWSIFEYITPNDLLLFKRNKEYMLVPHASVSGVLVELFYEDTDDDN